MKKIRIHYVLILIILLIATNVENSIAQTGKNDLAKIQNESNPLIPFGAITGKPTKTQILKYLDSFRSVGIDQFLIYPRSGLELEYMSDEWLDVCEYIIEYAEEYDMSIWIYDEFNWPSGSCKGQVIKQNKDFGSKKITVWENPVNLGKQNYFWSVSSVPIYANLLNPGAVEQFISLTHEKYYERFDKYFGTVIKGFFTDEPSPMYASQQKTAGSLLELTYWDNLESEYNQYSKRNFRLDVEAHLNGKTPSNLWQDYFYLMGKRFKATYFDKITSWCNQHNIVFTGHLMRESTPSGSIRASGNPMSVINAFSMPGIDEICTNTTLGAIEWVTLKMVENAVSEKNKGAFAELFAIGPCDMTLGKRRQMIWITALHGVDHYLLAVSPIDSRANIEKPDYYNPHTTTQPWFNSLKELGEDAKKAALFARKKSNQKIAVRYPQNLTASTLFFPKKDKPVFSLPKLLESLVSWQWNPKLIAEELIQTSQYQAVLSLTVSGIVEENTGNKFSSLEELSSWLGNNIQRSVSVENSKGELEGDVLVKTFKDGSVCVVSLSDTTHGQLVLKQPGVKPVLFDLPESGVFSYELGQPYKYKKNKNVLLFSDEERLTYETTSKNIKRIVFDKAGKFEFNVIDALHGISIAVRNYDDKVSLELDGKELSASRFSKLLPDGFKELYLESDLISLELGKHTLTLTSNSKDYPYFPSAFIGGDFATKSNTIFEALPKDISISGFRDQGFKDYIGGIKFKKEVSVNNEEFLHVDTEGLVAEIYINGQSIGRKAWAPFLWEIPLKYRGEIVDVEIMLWTSVGPLFGGFQGDESAEGLWLKKYAPK